MIDLPIIPKKARKAPHRKSDAIKELERLAYEDDRRRHPSIDIRYLAKRTYSDKTANKLTAAIVAYIRLLGGMASRINTTGLFDARRNKYRYTTQQKGLADVWATYQGKSLQIEVKKGLDRQSDHQAKVEEQQTAAGGYYFIAGTFEEFKRWIDTINGDAPPDR